MTKRDSLFYVLLALFIITIIITLLGVTKVIVIEEFYLKGLFAAFLIELGAAIFNIAKKGNLLGESINIEPQKESIPKNLVDGITSDAWFDAIIERLSDCGYARLYLRSFDHPDEFREEHRERLMKIISLISERIKSGADLKIISYATKANNKTGFDWVASKLGRKDDLNKFIKVINTQPVSNSTSMYLFDDKSVLYNKRNSGKISYHIDNYSNSIIHELIYSGFKVLEEAS